jgi:hypothetical protein
VNEPKRHHYLPQMYLRGFAAGERIWVYDRVRSEYREQGLADTAVQKDYYTIIEASGAKNRDLERILADIEGKAAEAIRLADQQSPLTEEQRAAIAVFVALLKVRTPNFEKSFADAQDQLLRKILKGTMNSEERIAASIAAYERDKGKKLALPPKELLDFFQRGQFSIEPHRNQTVAMMIELSSEFALLLAQMDWVFAHAPDGSEFITSDVPFGIIRPRDWKPGFFSGVGILTPGAVKSIPLTRTTMLLAMDKGEITRHTGMPAALVHDFNIATAARTERFALGRDRVLLEDLVPAARIDKRGTGPRMRVD